MSSNLDRCWGSDLQPGDASWVDRWAVGQPGNCVQLVSQALFDQDLSDQLLSGQVIDPHLFRSATGLTQVQSMLAQAYQRYRSLGRTIPSTPTDSYQSNAFALCRTVPGLCQSWLNDTCQNVTRDQLAVRQNLIGWCGCYMNEAEYDTYVNKYQINRECTPTCSRDTVIPLATADGLGQKVCQQNVCVINDITIALSQSNVGREISFTQVCGTCGREETGTGKASCRCYIEGESVDVVNSQIGGLDWNQYCGDLSQCRGELCGQSTKTTYDIQALIIFLVILFVIIVFFFSFLIRYLIKR